MYSEALRNLSKADRATIQNWILDKIEGKPYSPLDSDFPMIDPENSTILSYLYEHSDPITQSKIEEALRLLVTESISQKKYQVLSEVTFAILKIGCDFPFQVLIDFMAEVASNPDLRFVKSDILSLLQSNGKDSEPLFEKCLEWYLSDPITVGNEHALELFSILVEIKPADFAPWLLRLDHINTTHGSKIPFEPQWVWGFVVDNCTEDELQNGLIELPSELANQLHELRRNHPDLYSCKGSPISND